MKEIADLEAALFVGDLERIAEAAEALLAVLKARAKVDTAPLTDEERAMLDEEDV